LLLTHEKGESPEDGSGSGANTLDGGQDLNQLGGSIDEPSLEQNRPNYPRTDLRIGSRTGTKTGFRIVSKPISLSIPTKVESVSVDPLAPRPWKHQSLHPLENFLSDINTGVQTRSKLKTFCAFYAFLSNIEPKNVDEALAD